MKKSHIKGKGSTHIDIPKGGVVLDGCSMYTTAESSRHMTNSNVAGSYNSYGVGINYISPSNKNFIRRSCLHDIHEYRNQNCN